MFAKMTDVQVSQFIDSAVNAWRDESRLRISSALDEIGMVKTARDLVYAQLGRGTMYLDVIQDMIDWIADSGIIARARLGEWRKDHFGYVLPVSFETGNEIIYANIVALSGDDLRYSYTVVVEMEFDNLIDCIVWNYIV